MHTHQTPHAGHTPSRHAPARHHINLRLERWHRRCMYVSLAALLASGALWLLARYFLRAPGQFGETIHPLEPWAMKLHGASVMLALFFLGSLMNAHIRRALKAGRNLATGWGMMLTLLFLIFTGYCLYYVAGEADRPLWSVLHWAVGLATGALFLLHIVLGRRSNPHRPH